MSRDQILRIVAGVVLITAILRAQAPDQKPLAFEVASIKPNVSRQVGNCIDAMQPGADYDGFR